MFRYHGKQTTYEMNKKMEFFAISENSVVRLFSLFVYNNLGNILTFQHWCNKDLTYIIFIFRGLMFLHYVLE